MSNKPFRFKKFTIHQDQCAMKVGTDGVLLGAWSAVENRKNILDVGTGTGLVAMMMAQRNPHANIDAVEIDVSAYLQAKYNFQQTDFTNLTVYESDFNDFETTKSYDLIVSNPPFFEVNKQMNDSNRKMARQQNVLSFDNLIQKSVEILQQKGQLELILPFEAFEEITAIAQKNKLFLQRLTKVKGNPQTDFKRILVSFGFDQTKLLEEELIIEKTRHQYTDEYIALTKDFYLKM